MSTAGPTRRAKAAKVGGGPKAAAAARAGAAAAAKVPRALPLWRRLLLQNQQWTPVRFLLVCPVPVFLVLLVRPRGCPPLRFLAAARNGGGCFRCCCLLTWTGSLLCSFCTVFLADVRSSRAGHRLVLVRVTPPAVTRSPLTPQDEVLTALHWVRQAYGVGVGLLFGLLGVTGAAGAIAYLLSCFVLTTGYVHWENGWVASGAGGGAGGGLWDGRVCLLGGRHCREECLSVVVIPHASCPGCGVRSNLGRCGAFVIARLWSVLPSVTARMGGSCSPFLPLARPHSRDRSYFRVYLGVDEEDLADAPGGGSLQTEGLFSSVALFVLTWTLSYSLIHAAA